MSPTIRDLHAWQTRVSAKTVWSHLAVTDSHGRTGWGEFTIAATTAALGAGVRHAAQAVVGRPAIPDRIPQAASMRSAGRVPGAVYCALDQALWDLRAQRAELRLADALSADHVREAVPLYANINRGTVDRSPEGFAGRALKAAAEGHDAVKIAPFDGLTPAVCESGEADALIAAGLSRARAARSGLGTGPALMVDCHWRLTPAAALALIPALAEVGIDWLECPIEERPETVAALREIRTAANRRGIRLAGCETLTGWEAFSPFVEGGAYDVVMPDVKYAGGLTEITRIASHCARAGVELSLHNPSGPIAHAASLHVAGALPQSGRLEFQYGESERFSRLVDGALPGTGGGASRLPPNPGLGVTPNPRDLVALED